MTPRNLLGHLEYWVLFSVIAILYPVFLLLWCKREILSNSQWYICLCTCNFSVDLYFLYYRINISRSAFSADISMIQFSFCHRITPDLYVIDSCKTKNLNYICKNVSNPIGMFTLKWNSPKEIAQWVKCFNVNVMTWVWIPSTRLSLGMWGRHQLNIERVE